MRFTVTDLDHISDKKCLKNFTTSLPSDFCSKIDFKARLCLPRYFMQMLNFYRVDVRNLQNFSDVKLDCNESAALQM